MNRRSFLTVAVCAAVCGHAAFAQNYADSVVDQLRQQGFARITVRRTLLGRTQIVAQGNGGRREIILNPRTGEILRDFWQANSGSDSGNGDRLLREDSGGRGRGRGGDDNNDDSDNSGQGGGDDNDDRDDDSDGRDYNSGGDDDDDK